jgi:hypothetical protein
MGSRPLPPLATIYYGIQEECCFLVDYIKTTYLITLVLSTMVLASGTPLQASTLPKRGTAFKLLSTAGETLLGLSTQ